MRTAPLLWMPILAGKRKDEESTNRIVSPLSLSPPLSLSLSLSLCVRVCGCFFFRDRLSEVKENNELNVTVTSVRGSKRDKKKTDQ